MTAVITSAQNPKLQRVRALLEKRRQREAENAFVVEGVRLVEEALASDWQAELVLYAAGLSDRGQILVRRLQQESDARRWPGELWEVSPRLMETVTGTETPQGLLAVLARRRLPLPELLNFVLICDNIRDPGNLGTLLRTASAAGVQAVLLSPGTADPFSPKVLRAGMGAHFRLPIFEMSWKEIRALCRGRSEPLSILLADIARTAVLWTVDLRRPLALIVGSEADGASPAAQALADQTITIPMPGQSESLNAAVAASILMFEVVRQRQP